MRLLDLTRLVSRQGRGPMTGVDRVEFAYLTRLLGMDAPVFGLVRTRFGFVLLDRRGMQGVSDRVASGGGKPDLLSHLSWRGNPARAASEADVRRDAIGRALVPFLGRLLRRLPDGFSYLNVGHANLTDRVMRAVKARGGRIAVLVHDTIPLEHPEFTKAGIPEVFGRKLRAVAAHADLVIHTTKDARTRTEAQLARRGRVPRGLVANLGVTLVDPDWRHLPPGLDLTAPYVLSIGTVEPRKNHELLLKVWRDGRDLPRLIVAGSMGWADPATFARLATTPGVTLISGLDDAAVAALLSGARALVFPSLAEGFGLPPLEAAARGVPVIVADLPVFRELLGDYPVYLSPSDSYSWMETIRALGNPLIVPQKGAPRLTAPNWDAHFNTVFTND